MVSSTKCPQNTVVGVPHHSDTCYLVAVRAAICNCVQHVPPSLQQTVPNQGAVPSLCHCDGACQRVLVYTPLPF